MEQWLHWATGALSKGCPLQSPPWAPQDPLALGLWLHYGVQCVTPKFWSKSALLSTYCMQSAVQRARGCHLGAGVEPSKASCGSDSTHGGGGGGPWDMEGCGM